MNFQLFRIGLVVFSIAMYGCSDKPRPKNVIEPAEVPASFSLKSERFDQGLFQNSGSLESLQKWHYKQLASGPAFYKVYMKEVMQTAPDSGAALSLYKFSGNAEWKDLQREIEKKYPTTDSIQQQFNTVFGRFKELFPSKTSPTIYYFNSGFNVGIWPDTNLLGIGLEWYLGKDNRIVKLLPQDFPQYQRDNMDPAYLVPDAVKGWLLLNFFKKEYADNLLEYIVFYGKVIYAAEAGLAPIADTSLLSYSTAQMTWCYEQENNIWKEIVSNDKLFSTKERDLLRFTSDGPFTSGFPQDGAPMVGVYIGWKMVADYMKKNPDTSLQDLMTKVPAKQVLKAYKPKK